MRIVIAGSGSFIARAVAEACAVKGVECRTLSHAQDPRQFLSGGDFLINFAIAPTYRTGPYDRSQDYDVRAAEAAAEAGPHFNMLSTRRVYPEGERWNAHEQSRADGDETPYGRNKAISEKAVLQTCGKNAAIFRLANIFGYEYASQPRRSFMGQLLHGLKNQNKISFDMHSETRRDFLPVEICAALLTARTLEGHSGIFNLGSGFPVRCGDLAGWIMAGYGGGDLICEPPVIRDEFYLNMNNWRAHFDLPIDPGSIRDYCNGLGRRLACEKF